MQVYGEDECRGERVGVVDETATTECYTLHSVGSVRCVEETGDFSVAQRDLFVAQRDLSVLQRVPSVAQRASFVSLIPLSFPP